MDLALAEPTFRIEHTVRIEEPISTFELPSGWAFRVDLDGRPIGAVFVAGGAWTVAFERSADARAAANRLVVLDDLPAADLAPVVAGGDLGLRIDRGLVLGNDVWSGILPSLREVGLRRDLVVVDAPDAAEEVLVFEDRSAAAARRIAEDVLAERTGWRRAHSFDPVALLEADRLQPADLRTLVAEFRTDRAWDRFAGDTEVEAGQRWLLYVRDPSGAFDREARALVLAESLRDEDELLRRAVARERFPHGADGAPRAPHRLDLAAASATVTFRPDGPGHALLEHAVADLAVVAVGGPVRVAFIDVPHVEQQPFTSQPPLPEGWVLDGVSLVGGSALEVRHLPLTGRQEDGRGPVRTLAVVLPEELGAGEVATLRVSWQDRHRFVHVLERSTFALNWEFFQYDDLGTTTELASAIPRLRTSAAPPAAAAVRVGLPVSAPREERVAVSGVRSEPWEDLRWRWTEAETHANAAAVAVGRWKEWSEPARAGFPAVRALLRTQGSDVGRSLPMQVRALLHAWQDLLPPYPAREVCLAELHMHSHRVLGILAGDGLVGVHPMRHVSRTVGEEASLRRRLPHFEVWALATGLHAHWWHATDAPGGDGLALDLGVVFGTKTVGALHGADEERAWFEQLRRSASPEDRSVDGWADGAFVVGRTIGSLVGDAAVYEAIDRVLSGGHPPTWDGLEAALVAASGRDLSGVFDTWIRAGVAPSVDLVWSATPGGARIELTTDVPFGTLPVPVRIRGDHGVADVVVEVVDGRGAIEVPWSGEVRGAEVDPDGVLLLARP